MNEIWLINTYPQHSLLESMAIPEAPGYNEPSGGVESEPENPSDNGLPAETQAERTRELCKASLDNQILWLGKVTFFMRFRMKNVI
jgi:hypothetical protein